MNLPLWTRHLTALMTLFALILTSEGCSSFGQAPSHEKRKAFTKSSQYDKEKSQFINRKAGIIAQDRDKAFNFSTIWEWLIGIENAKPTKKLPEVKVNLKSFFSSNQGVQFIWLGHSSLLMNFAGVKLLIDPVFSGSASPFSFMVQRFQEPIVRLKELPKIDFVVISHDHYDHLDQKTIEYFRETETVFITPLGVGSHLTYWGVKPEQIIERDWFESYSSSGIDFVATPSQHFSGRSLSDENKTLWASWVIKSKDHAVYFSGDSGYDTHFQEIGTKLGPFDIAFIENGQYDKRWPAAHLFPEEAAQVYLELRAKRIFPIHWGMFELAMHPWNEPPTRLTSALSSPSALVVPKLGFQYSLDNLPDLEYWWIR